MIWLYIPLALVGVALTALLAVRHSRHVWTAAAGARHGFQFEAAVDHLRFVLSETRAAYRSAIARGRVGER